MCEVEKQIFYDKPKNMSSNIENSFVYCSAVYMANDGSLLLFASCVRPYSFYLKILTPHYGKDIICGRTTYMYNVYVYIVCEHFLFRFILYFVCIFFFLFSVFCSLHYYLNRMWTTAKIIYWLYLFLMFICKRTVKNWFSYLVCLFCFLYVYKNWYVSYYKRLTSIFYHHIVYLIDMYD